MKIIDFVKLFNQTDKQPVVEFLKDADTDYEGHQVGTRGKLLSIIESGYFSDDGSYEFLIDLSPFEQHNRSIAKHEWFDEIGKLTATWFESDCYPKNGLYSQFLIPKKDDDLLKIVPDKSLNLFNDYLASGSKLTYIDWLEISLEGLLKVSELH